MALLATRMPKNASEWTDGQLLTFVLRNESRGWMELAYGLGGLFIMGLGIRAVLQVAA